MNFTVAIRTGINYAKQNLLKQIAVHRLKTLQIGKGRAQHGSCMIQTYTYIHTYIIYLVKQVGELARL